MNTKSSLKSLLSLVALVAAVLFAGSAVAATVPVYGSVSDITENTVILTGDATVTSSKGVGGNVTYKIHFNNVAGRSVMSNVALQAASDQTVVKLLAGSTTLSVPVTIFPVGSDITDPQAFTVMATLNLTVDTATAAVKGGMSQFTIVLQEPAP
ncbi:MAG: hypothetical protein ACJ78W_06820 [Myxococcales bacterium]